MVRDHNQEIRLSTVSDKEWKVSDREYHPDEKSEGLATGTLLSRVIGAADNYALSVRAMHSAADALIENEGNAVVSAWRELQEARDAHFRTLLRSVDQATDGFPGIPATGKKLPEKDGRLSGSDARNLQRLTQRESEVLRMVGEGKRTKAIAALLGISQKTVNTHRSHIMDKLGIHDTPGLVRIAIRSGLCES